MVPGQCILCLVAFLMIPDVESELNISLTQISFSFFQGNNISRDATLETADFLIVWNPRKRERKSQVSSFFSLFVGCCPHNFKQRLD